MTPPVVSMHACSIWPLTIDFITFRYYLLGLSVEEAVEVLLGATDTEDASNARANAPRSSTAAAGEASTPTPTSSSPYHPKEEDARHVDASSTLQVGQTRRHGTNSPRFTGTGSPQLGSPSRSRSVLTSPSSQHQLLLMNAGGSHMNATTSKDAAGQGRGGGRRRGSHHRGPINNNRRAFFLNEDYLDFQQVLLQEAGGGARDAALPHCGASLKTRLLMEEVTEQYRLFAELTREELLGTPYAFLTCSYLPLSVSDRRRLVNLYYEVDPAVLHACFGARLTNVAITDTRESSAFTFQSWWYGSAAQRTPMALLGLPANSNLLLEHRDGSLKRQWENIKAVCATITAMYRGKGGMLIPSSTPVLTAVQRCFGLNNQLAVNYATMVFGHEHRLTGKLIDRLATFEELSSVVSVIGSLWCDATELQLAEDFIAGCRRLIRLLEDHRLLADMHHALFGEVLRARWQLQLDEMQRAITNNTPMGDPMTPQPGREVGSPNFPVMSGGMERMGSPPPPPLLVTGPLPSTPHSSNVPPSVTSTAFVNTSPSPPPPVTGIPNAAALCANGAYSRRFCSEFVSIIKNILRVLVHVGQNENLSEGLDLFYSRIYSSLDMICNRSAAPGNVFARLGIQSEVPQSMPLASGGGIGGGGCVNGSAHGAPTLSSVGRGMTSPTFGERSPPGSLHRRMFPSLGGAEGMRPGTAMSAVPITAGGANVEAAQGAPGSPIGAVLNSSMMLHPTPLPMLSTSNSPLMRSTSAMFSSATAPPPPPLRVRSPLPSADGVGSLMRREEDGASQDPVGARHPLVNGSVAALPSGFQGGPFTPTPSSSLFLSGGGGGDAVVRATALEKPCLRELSKFFGALPTVWAGLVSLSVEEHAATDGVMANFVLALKAITQILMASEDFR